jgi:putative transcriptional regulator
VVIDASDMQAGRYAQARTAPSRLRLWRVALGFTQAQLAQRAGIARITVGALERHENSPNLATAHALAEALGVEVADLFPNDERRPHQVAAVRNRPVEGRRGKA